MSKKGKDYSQLLIWAAVLVTVIRYAGAFAASDAGEITGIWSIILTGFMTLSGLGMGVLDVLGGAYLFDGWRRVMPKAGQAWPFKFRVLTVFVFALVLVGVCIIIPFTVSRVAHEPMAATVPGAWLWVWAVMVNVAPYLLIGGVATASQVVTVSSAEIGGNLPQETRKENGNLPENWRKIRKRLTPEQLEFIANAKHAGEISGVFGCTERTARNWRDNARKEAQK